ncbi:hypothetical protein EDD15DRAFT_2514820 [Pisolithus albus]|nr:hypothetical protein EDD15DRAFT_2514820 [Pisolithus albus]
MPACRLLGAYLYHRALVAVPALIRSWISDRTDKQLHTRITNYTSTHFSPEIIKAELMPIQQPPESSELSTTENLSIKISSAPNEVTASYLVDDQPVELSIRMPNDWPLQPLVGRETKKVGISDEKLKAWMVGVTQIVCQHDKWNVRFATRIIPGQSRECPFSPAAVNGAVRNTLEYWSHPSCSGVRAGGDAIEFYAIR